MDLYQAITRYKQIGTRDADSFFGWLYGVYRGLYLPCVDPRYIQFLAEVKTKLAIFDVMLDDLADDHHQRNWDLLMKLSRIPFSEDLELDDPLLLFGRDLWKSCIASIERYPRYQEFRRLFCFDLKQVLLSMEYGYLVNEEGIGNRHEDAAIHPHGCMVILHCDLDLMCSPSFNKDELPAAREAFYLAQRAVNLGNTLSTYPKELFERDKASVIIGEGLRQGLISDDDFQSGDNIEQLEARLKPLEGRLLHEARLCLAKIIDLAPLTPSMDMYEVANRYEHVFDQYRSLSLPDSRTMQSLTTTGEFPAPIKHDKQRQEKADKDRGYAALRSLLTMAKS